MELQEMQEVVRQYNEVINQAHGLVPDATLAPLRESLQQINRHIHQKISQKTTTDALKNELSGHATAYIARAKGIQRHLEKTENWWTLRKKHKARLINQALNHIEDHQSEILDEFLRSTAPKDVLNSQGALTENVLELWFQHLDQQHEEACPSVAHALQYRRYGRFSCLLPFQNKRPTSTSQQFNRWKQSYSEVANSPRLKK